MNFYKMTKYTCNWGFPGDSVVKNLPADARDTEYTGLIPVIPLEEEIVTHSSILAWKIPEEPGELRSMGLQRVRHN